VRAGRETWDRRGADVFDAQRANLEGSPYPNALGFESRRPARVVIGDHDLAFLAAADQDLVEAQIA
jgi:hypothetical protein